MYGIMSVLWKKNTLNHLPLLLGSNTTWDCENSTSIKRDCLLCVITGLQMQHSVTQIGVSQWWHHIIAYLFQCGFAPIPTHKRCNPHISLHPEKQTCNIMRICLHKIQQADVTKKTWQRWISINISSYTSQKKQKVEIVRRISFLGCKQNLKSFDIYH